MSCQKIVLFYNIEVNYLTSFSFSFTFLLWSDYASKMKRFFFLRCWITSTSLFKAMATPSHEAQWFISL